jgi:hypothetical protein
MYLFLCFLIVSRQILAWTLLVDRQTNTKLVELCFFMFFMYLSLPMGPGQCAQIDL